ncbi:MAG: aminopeptidase N, partial [Gammaproteobacteria bacterium]|nr:aminopeptidase N [Gammaproteobacteria bacterium]
MADISTESAATPGAIYLKDYQPPAWLVENVDLIFDLDADNTEVRSNLSIKKNPDYKNQTSSIVLNGHELELISVSLNGQVLKQDDYKLYDEVMEIMEVPDQFDLELVTRIHPAANTALE